MHHVIIDNPRQWHKIILFIIWAIREVPNATGVAPYMLVYGRSPRGPLAVLKESWTGDINLPPRLGLQPKKYLQKMKENLEKHWCMLTNIPRKSSYSTTRKSNTKGIFQTDDAFTCVCQEKERIVVPIITVSNA